MIENNCQIYPLSKDYPGFEVNFDLSLFNLSLAIYTFLLAGRYNGQRSTVTKDTYRNVNL